MGEEHFLRMYEQALELDSRAFPYAILRYMDAQDEAVGTRSAGGLSPFWEMPFDQLMDLSRKLLELDDTFIGALQLMIVEGRIRARIPVMGSMKPTRDPMVMTYDDPRCNDGTLANLMKIYK